MVENVDTLEQAILSALAGAPVEEVARIHGVNTHTLQAAVEAYRAAGRQAIATVNGQRWHYWRIPLRVSEARAVVTQADELLVTEIAPLCTQLTSEELISRWWFLRKGDEAPHLHLRIFGEEPELSKKVIPYVEDVLGNIERSGRISHWTTLCYEPETMVFGGSQGMEVAHDLFHKDSLTLCQWLAIERQFAREAPQSQPHKRRAEASLLVIQRLLRGAGLDIFEQWDVWTRMTHMRPWTTTAAPAQRKKNTATLAYLLFEASQPQLTEVFGDKLYTVVSTWGEHFEQTGKALARLNRQGSLGRGLREILASHIIFHWNRFGFGVALQAELPRLAEMVYRERCAFFQEVHKQ